MEQKIATTIFQSKKLLELGLSPDTADMWWLYITAQGKHILHAHDEPDPHYINRMESYGIKDCAIPAWSLSALLELMPKDRFIDIELSYGGFSVDPLEYIEKWFISFENEKDYESDIKTFSSEHPIDAVFEMVCWLLGQGFIEKAKIRHIYWKGLLMDVSL